MVSAWLTLLDHTPEPARVWRPGTVLIVDEATQVCTRDAERLLSYAARTGTVVILVGDPAQLGPVGTGGWFADLVAADSTVPALEHNQRQRHPGMAQVRRALAALRTGTPASARHSLDTLARDGRLQLCRTRSELLAAVVDDWHADRARSPTAAAHMLAETHRDAELLNAAARLRLAADGTLSGPTLTAAGRDFQAGDRVITLTQAGHTLIPAGRPRSAYIRTGSTGTISAVDTTRRAVTVEFPGKGTVHIGSDYLTHRFPDGRDGALTHAYALTAHKAEGATVHTARAVVPDDTSRPGLYVMLSRASHHLRAYLIARPDLDDDPTDETWLPVLRDPRPAHERLTDQLSRHHHDQLVSRLDPDARRVHQLRTAQPLPVLARSGQPLAQRAAAAEAAALAGTAPTEALPAALLAGIGPRPDQQPDRATWDAAVTALAACRAKHPPPAADDPPGPMTADAAVEAVRDRRRAERLLEAAEANHLARRPTDLLQAEHARLTGELTMAGTANHTRLRRLRLLDAALARHVDRAALLLTHEPADYLVDLLGPRPADPALAADWDRDAVAVEHHRHYRLGLPSGAATPAGPTTDRRHPPAAHPRVTLDIPGPS